MAAGYGEELLGRVSGLVLECTRRVSRATRRLLRRRHHHHHHGGHAQRRRKQQQGTGTTGTVAAAALCARGAAIDKGRTSASGEQAAALWSRRILMGKRCQPLDFAGAIHYDSAGRRLARPPMPRSASSLSSFRSSSGSGRSNADVSDASCCCPAENDDGDSSSSSS